LDDIPRPAWIAIMVLGFIAWWPLGLAILAYILWSGRMSCGGRYGSWREERDRMRHMAHRWWHGRGERHEGNRERRYPGPPSGNRAFDEYREETLRRLEDEQREFRDFLDRLRHAKDKAEFDQFMADRARRAQEPPPPPPTEGDAPPAR
jgi:hypothetical protein